jgi:acetyl esterase/lipase
MIRLWEKEVPGFQPEFGQELPSITPYWVKDIKKPAAIVVCPGGGYWLKAEHEGRPIAEWLNRLGISAFVLDYRVAPYRHPYPSMDAKRAIRFVRHHAQTWGIDPEKIGILGFSAGGHLASTAGTHFDYGMPDAEDPVDRISSRPDAMVLCYPVVSFGKYRHEGSMINLLGEAPDAAMQELLSNEKQVGKDTPPTFLWHSADDDVVPVENSLFLAEALSRHKVNCELHVFPKGQHGAGLAEDNPQLSLWTTLCENWLQSIGFI